MAVEDLLCSGPAAEDLDQRVAGVHLLDMAVQRAGHLPLGGELFLRPAPDDDDRHDRQGHRHQ